MGIASIPIRISSGGHAGSRRIRRSGSFFVGGRAVGPVDGAKTVAFIEADGIFVGIGDGVFGAARRVFDHVVEPGCAYDKARWLNNAVPAEKWQLRPHARQPFPAGEE